MKPVRFLLLAMSVLRAIWEPAAPARKKARGYFTRIEMEHAAHDRERSPRRRCGVKAHLKSWAKGEISTACMWRLCHSIVTEDGTDAGAGIARLAELGSTSGSSEQNCMRSMKTLLAGTSLPGMIQEIAHEEGEYTVTHTLLTAITGASSAGSSARTQ